MSEFLQYIWPGLAVWLAWIWVAIWQWILAKRAMEVMGKNPSLNTFYLTLTILWIALVESAVIYGLVVAFSIFGNETLSFYSSIWAGLAIGLTGLGAGIWEWMLIAGAMWAIDKNPDLKAKIMTFMVLFVALVEVTAIYGLIVAFKIIGDTSAVDVHLWAGLAIWLAWVWVAIGIWYLSQRSLEVMSETPHLTNFFLTVAILWVALVESAAIYGLVVAFQLLGSPELGFYAAIWAGLAIGLTWFWAGWWEGQLMVWALTAMNRNPEIKAKIMTFMVLFVALVEVTAIYGLIIAFKIMWMEWVDTASYVWAGLAIWLAGLWVWIWRWYLSDKSLEVMGKNPKMISFFLTVAILWVALVESAAIYALIVSFKILSVETLIPILAIGAWFAIGLTWFGVWIWEGLLIKGAIESMNTSPDTKGKIMAFMVLFVALIEVVAIYGLIISFKLLA